MLRDKDNDSKDFNRLLHAPQDDGTSGTEEPSVFGTFFHSQGADSSSGSSLRSQDNTSSADPAFMLRHDLEDDAVDAATDGSSDDDEIRGPLFLSFKANDPASDVSEALREQNKTASLYQSEPIEDPEFPESSDDVFSTEDQYMDAFAQDDPMSSSFPETSRASGYKEPEQPKQPPRTSMLDTMYAKEDYRKNTPKYEIDSSLEDEINASLADENFSPFSPFAAFKPATPELEKEPEPAPAPAEATETAPVDEPAAPVVEEPSIESVEEPVAPVEASIPAPFAGSEELPVSESSPVDEPVSEPVVAQTPVSGIEVEVAPAFIPTPVEVQETPSIPVETPEQASVPEETPEAVSVHVETPDSASIQAETSEAVSIPVEVPETASIPVEVPETAAIPVETPMVATSPVETTEAAPISVEIPEQNTSVDSPVAQEAEETANETVPEEAVSEPVVTEEAVSEPVVAEETPVSQPAVEESVVAEAPVIEEAVAEAPVTEEPVIEESTVTEAPVTEEPVSAEPVIEEPVVEEPVADTAPASEETVEETPVKEETPSSVTEDIATVSSFAGQPDSEDSRTFATSESNTSELVTPTSLEREADPSSEDHEPSTDSESPSDIDASSLYDTAPIDDPSMDDFSDDFQSIYRENEGAQTEQVSYSAPAIHPHVSIASSNLEPIDRVYNSPVRRQINKPEKEEGGFKNHLLFGDEDEKTFHEAAMREAAEKKKAAAEAAEAAAAAATAQSASSNLRPGSSAGGNHSTESKAETNTVAETNTENRNTSRPGASAGRPGAVSGMSTSAQVVKAQHHRYTAAAQRGSITPVEQQEHRSERKKSIVKPIIFICLGLICLGGLVFCWQYFDLGKAFTAAGSTTEARSTTKAPKTTSVIEVSSDSETEEPDKTESSPETTTEAPATTTTTEAPTTTTEAPTTTTEAPTTTTEAPTTTTEAPTTTTEKPTTTTEKPTSKEPTETTSTPAPSEYPVTSFNTKIVNAKGSSNACSFDLKFTNNGSKTSSVNASIEYVTFTLVSDTTVTDISCTNFTIEKKEGTSNTYYLYPNSDEAIAKGESLYATIEASGNSSFGSYKVKNLYVEYKK